MPQPNVPDPIVLPGGSEIPREALDSLIKALKHCRVLGASVMQQWKGQPQPQLDHAARQELGDVLAGLDFAVEALEEIFFKANDQQAA